MTNKKSWLKRVFFEDQYHLGSTELTNPTRNHYIIGFFPATRVHGETVKGKIRTIGISARFRADSNMYIENNGSYGFILNDNEFGDGCVIGRNTAGGVFGNVNGFGDGCVIGRNTAGGVFGNGNFFGDNCVMGKNLVVGLGNINDYGDNCEIKESSKVISFFNFGTENIEVQSGLLENSVMTGIKIQSPSRHPSLSQLYRLI
ncbi:MAG: hypothetical protein ABIF18_02445 [archaeon]